MDKKLGLQSVMETVDFVRKAWGNIGLPSNFAPTMDVEELDKRIADLKAVEQWLNVNQSMLRGTIQGLEVQRNTIATVQAFGKAVKSGGSQPFSSDAFSKEFANAFAKEIPTAPDLASLTSFAAPVSSAKKRATVKKKTASNSPTSPAVSMPGLDAGAWWEMLQGQFNQIAQAALSGDAQSTGKRVTRAAGKVASEMASAVAKNAVKQVASTVANKVATGAAKVAVNAATRAFRGVQKAGVQKAGAQQVRSRKPVGARKSTKPSKNKA